MAQPTLPAATASSSAGAPFEQAQFLLDQLQLSSIIAQLKNALGLPQQNNGPPLSTTLPPPEQLLLRELISSQTNQHDLRLRSQLTQEILENVVQILQGAGAVPGQLISGQFNSAAQSNGTSTIFSTPQTNNLTLANLFQQQLRPNQNQQSSASQVQHQAPQSEQLLRNLVQSVIENSVQNNSASSLSTISTSQTQQVTPQQVLPQQTLLQQALHQQASTQSNYASNLLPPAQANLANLLQQRLQPQQQNSAPQISPQDLIQNIIQNPGQNISALPSFNTSALLAQTQQAPTQVAPTLVAQAQVPPTQIVSAQQAPAQQALQNSVPIQDDILRNEIRQMDSMLQSIASQSNTAVPPNPSGSTNTNQQVSASAPSVASVAAAGTTTDASVASAAGPSPTAAAGTTSSEFPFDLASAQAAFQSQVMAPLLASSNSMAGNTSAPTVTTESADGTLQSRAGLKCPTEATASELAAMGYLSVPRRTKEDRWMARYEQLKLFQQSCGHCRVPHGFPENRKLAWWVMNQRAQYRLLHQGKKTWLTEERVRLLDDIGFEWNPTSENGGNSKKKSEKDEGEDEIEQEEV